MEITHHSVRQTSEYLGSCAKSEVKYLNSEHLVLVGEAKVLPTIWRSVRESMYPPTVSDR